MLWKTILTLAFMAALLPREPDIGLPTAPDFAIAGLERAPIAALMALHRVRIDLKENGGGRL